MVKWSKVPALGSSLSAGMGLNPTAAILYFRMFMTYELNLKVLNGHNSNFFFLQFLNIWILHIFIPPLPSVTFECRASKEWRCLLIPCKPVISRHTSKVVWAVRYRCFLKTYLFKTAFITELFTKPNCEWIYFLNFTFTCTI